jgi:hypothetical protein
MREYRHSAGARACFKVAFCAPESFLEIRPTPIPRPLCGSARTAGCGRSRPARWTRCAVTGVARCCTRPTSRRTRPPRCSSRADRRRPDPVGKHVRLTRALVKSGADIGCVTPKQIAEYLRVDPRAITAAMESGTIASAFRFGQRGGVGEWRCPSQDAWAYINRLEERATDPAA